MRTIEKYTLNNGIPLFVVQTHEAPVVSIQAWVSRGSVHESESLSGISHFLEHALFKGTRRRGVGQAALDIERCGGEFNAFTSYEETVYHVTLPSRSFDEGLDVLCDLIQNPTFDSDEMSREKEVILEEIKRAHDSPHKILSMNLWEKSFPASPYGRPVLGFRETVSAISPASLRSYFQANYHAGTICLVVVGSVDKGRVFDRVQAQLSRVKLRKSTRAAMPRPGTASRVRLASAVRDVNECHVLIGIRAPEITNRMTPILDLACSAIGEGESSRLYQHLVKEKCLALDVQMGLVATNGCGLASIGILVAPDKLIPALEALSVLLQGIAETGLREAEIKRVKHSMEAEVIYGKETVEGYARRLGYYYCHFGDPEFEQKYMQAVLSVERSDLMGSMNHLLSQKPVLSVVMPKGFELNKKKALSALAIQPPKRLVLYSHSPFQPEQASLNGLSFITKKMSALPMITMKAIFLGGSREEEEGQFGIGNLFSRMWTAGTSSFRSVDIAHRLESLGASLHGFCGRNTVGLSLEFLAKDWSSIRPLFREILLQPTFPEEELTIEKNLILHEILSEKDSPSQLCSLNFLSNLYGTHPYGRSILGTAESVSSLTRTHLQRFYQKQVNRAHLVISTVGDFDREEWMAELAQAFSELAADGQAPRPPIPVSAADKVRVVSAAKQPLFQSHVVVGFLGPTIHDTDRYALRLLNSMLAGQGGRLFLELRDNQSLAYSVAPLGSESPEPGFFGVYIGCSPEKLDRALVAIREELSKVLEKAVPNKELERAKQFWIGRFELDKQRYASQAMLFGLDESYGLGYDHSIKVADLMQSVTAKQILEAAHRYVQLDKAILSIVHPTPLEEEQVHRMWSQGKRNASVSERTAEKTL
ncbi:MAG: insulinase family protein [Deltaproteobacteria bacterium]|nr:insulinase family protein [Deltaproteobacteria bacterium]